MLSDFVAYDLFEARFCPFFAWRAMCGNVRFRYFQRNCGKINNRVLSASGYL